MMVAKVIEDMVVPRRTYQAHEVAAIRQRLRDAEPALKPAGYTTRQVVRELAAELQMMSRDKGYTVAELATYLSDNGFPIGPRTLGQYLRDEGIAERKRRRKQGSKRRTKAGVQSPAAAVGSDESAQESARVSEVFDTLSLDALSKIDRIGPGSGPIHGLDPIPSGPVDPESR